MTSVIYRNTLCIIITHDISYSVVRSWVVNSWTSVHIC